jgi:hypothetical protein
MRDAPIGTEAQDGVGEGLFVEVTLEVDLDRRQGAVTELDRGAVMGKGGSQGPVLEVQARKPTLELEGPVGAVAVDQGVAQQELRETVACPGEVLDHIAPGAAQVTHGFLGR